MTENEVYDQRRVASLIFDRVMEKGSEKFGFEWFLFHEAISDLAEREYLPSQFGDLDDRIKAVFAEIALAILSRYKLVKRDVE